MKMVDVKIHTDALLHTKDNGELVFVTIGKYKHTICVACGIVSSEEVKQR